MNHLCWTQSNKLLLTKSLSSVDKRSSSFINWDNEYQKHALLVLLDLNCGNAEHVINQAIKSGAFNTPYRWLVIYDTTSAVSAYDTLMRAPLLVNTDIVLAQRLNNSIYMTEIHRPSMNHPMVITERGWWNTNGIKDTRLHKEFFRRRRNLMLKPITMSNVLIGSKSKTDADVGNHTKLDFLTQIFMITTALGVEMLNGTPHNVFSFDCGYEVSKDNWTGVVHDFIVGRADLGTGCYISHQRLNKVDYGDSGVPVTFKFIFRQPPLSYVANIYALPFSLGVWLATVILLLLCAFGMFLTTRWEFNNSKGTNIPDGSWGDVLLLTMGAVCQQGSEVEPKKASGRMILLILCMSLMALYAAYSANIVVLLQASSDSIKTLQQLHDSKLTLAAYDIHYNYFWLKNTNDTEIHRAVYRKIIGKDGRQNYYSLEEGVERIRQGMFAFHSVTEPVYKLIDKKYLESEKCDLVELAFLNSKEVFQTIAKDNPQKELFRVIFKQIREAGLTAANVIRYQIKKPKCSGSLVTFSSVGFTAFYPSLVFMSYGVALSVIILFVEIIVHTLIKKRQLVMVRERIPSFAS